MSKIMAILGAILLIAGIVITPWAMLVRAVEPLSDPYEVGGPEINSWNVSSKYLEGQRLILKISPGKDWAMFADQTDEYKIGEGGIPAAVLIVRIVILDPKGGKTEADVVYIAREGEGQPQRNLYLFLANLTRNDGGLTFEESYVLEENSKIYLGTPTKKYPVDGAFVGITNYEGKYEVVIPHSANDTSVPIPPSTLTLLKQRIRFVQPYLLITPIGVMFIAAGSFSAVLARRRISRGLRLKSDSGKK